MKTCLKCNTPAQDEDLFCLSCGNKFGGGTPTQPKCPKCGTEAQSDDKFCLSCGQNLQQPPPHVNQQSSVSQPPTTGRPAVESELPPSRPAMPVRKKPSVVVRDAMLGELWPGEEIIAEFEAKYRPKPYGILLSMIWWFFYIIGKIIFFFLTGWHGEDIAKCKLTNKRLVLSYRTFKNWPLWAIPYSEDKQFATFLLDQVNQVNFFKRVRGWFFFTKGITIFTVGRQGSLQAFKSMNENQIKDLALKMAKRG